MQSKIFKPGAITPDHELCSTNRHCYDWHEWLTQTLLLRKEFFSSAACRETEKGCEFCVHRIYQVVGNSCGTLRFREVQC